MKVVPTDVLHVVKALWGLPAFPLDPLDTNHNLLRVSLPTSRFSVRKFGVGNFGTAKVGLQ